MDAILLCIFSFLVPASDLENLAHVSRKWKELTDQPSNYESLSSVTLDGSVDWANFKNLGVKCKGIEGECFECLERSTGKILAMKRIRVPPKGERLPYYMIRELAALKQMSHDHITSLELASFSNDELHMFFPFVDKTLHDVINPTKDSEGGRALPEALVRKFLYQLLDGIAYCHHCGALHCNLKPKHLLIKTPDPENLIKCIASNVDAVTKL